MLKTTPTEKRCRYSCRLLAPMALLCLSMLTMAAGAVQAQPPNLVNPLLILEANTIRGVPNGGLFQTWNDTSGNGITMFAGNTADSKPTWFATAFGAAPGVCMTNFTGDGNLITLGGGNPLALQNVSALSVSIVFKTTDTGEFDALLTKCTAQDRGYGLIEFGVYLGALRHVYGPSLDYTFTSENPVNDGAAHVVTYIYDPLAQTQTWYIDGQNVGVLSGESNPPADTISNIYIGRMQNLSDPTIQFVSNGPNTDMTIGAIYMDGATWTPAQQAAVESYLGGKYGVAVYSPFSLTHGTLSQGVTGNTQARLVWTTALNGAGAYSYQLYRSTTKGFTPSPATAIGAPTSGLSQLDTGLTPGATYYYRLIVSDSAGGQSLCPQVAVTTLPANFQSILFIGDSITENGLPAYIIADLNASSQAIQAGITFVAINDGRGGSTSGDWEIGGKYYAQAAQDGMDGQVALISCMLGTNDAAASDQVTEYTANMLSCAEGFSGPLGAPIILHEPPYSAVRDQFNNPPLLPQYACALDEVAIEAGQISFSPVGGGNALGGQQIPPPNSWTVLDGDRTLYAAIEADPSLYLGPDGIHFTVAGNVLAGAAQALAIENAWLQTSEALPPPIQAMPSPYAPAIRMARP